MTSDLKAQVEEALVEARKHLNSQDAEVIQKATEALTTASNKMAEHMYQSTGANASGGPQSHQEHASSEQKTEGSSAKEDVIDADYKEV